MLLRTPAKDSEEKTAVGETIEQGKMEKGGAFALDGAVGYCRGTKGEEGGASPGRYTTPKRKKRRSRKGIHRIEASSKAGNRT